MSNHGYKTNTVLAFTLGAAAGGVTALLLAPRSGADLRKLVAERSDELKNNTSERARKVAERAKEAVDHTKEVAQQNLAAVREAIDQGKTAYQRELDQAKAG